MKSLIDVHIIELPGWFGQKDEWYKECLDSLYNQPINLEIVTGQWYHLGIGRYDGFSKGSGDYVTFVDPDDIVPPGVFKWCEDYLRVNRDVDVLVTDELRMNESGIIIPNSSRYHPVVLTHHYLHYLHHLVIVRRSILESHLSHFEIWPHSGDLFLYATLLANPNYKIVFTPLVGYHWRMRKIPARDVLFPLKDHVRILNDTRKVATCRRDITILAKT